MEPFLQYLNKYANLYPYWLPAVGMGLAALYAFLAWRPVARMLRPAGVGFLHGIMALVLLITALLAFGNYNRFGEWRYGSFLNAYEFYHYYLGSKYAQELGYFNLYNATLVADSETGLKFSDGSKSIRDLASGRYRPSKDVLADASKYKAKFSPVRWDEFVKDIEWFKKQLTRSRWNAMLRDKGYNATPVWGMLVGGFLTNPIPTSSPWGMNFIAALDLILIGIALALVCWAFGPRAALFMLLLLGTHYVMRYSHMKGALLRTDWAMCLVAGVCLLKKRWYRTAGTLVAYAALSRIFPIVFVFGLGAKGVWDLLRHWRFNRDYIRFITAFCMTALVLGVASVGYFGGTEYWNEYREKIGRHNQDVSPWRVGFKYLFTTEFKNECVGFRFYVDDAFKDDPPRIRRRIFEENQTLWWSIQAAMLVVCFFVVRGLKDHDALAFGFVPCFFLVAPTYYYYIMLLVPFLFFASQVDRPGRALGVMYTLLTGILGYPLYARWQQQYETYYAYSWLFLVIVLLMAFIAWRESRQLKKSLRY